MDDVPACLSRHRVLRHSLFQSWMRAAPSQRAIGAALHQLSVVKAASRDCGRLPVALHEGGWHDAGDAVAHALETERGHDRTCAAMAAHVLAHSPHLRQAVPPGDDAGAVQVLLRRLSDEHFAVAPGYDVGTSLLHETRAAIELLATRTTATAATAAHELGVLTAVEVVAARFYMPGERRAVVDAGHYGASIDHPAMHYFVEHEDLETEHEREAMIGWRDVCAPATEAALVAGATMWCDRFAALLDRLEQAVFA